MLSGGGITRLLNAPGYYMGGTASGSASGAPDDDSTSSSGYGGVGGDNAGSNNEPIHTPVVTTPESVNTGITGPLPREFGSYDFSAQYPTIQPDFNQLMVEYQKQPELTNFNFAGTVYQYDPFNNFFTDMYSGLGITQNNEQQGTLGIAGLYG